MLQSAVALRVASRHADYLARSGGAGGPHSHARPKQVRRAERAQTPCPSTLGSRSKRENISSELEETFSFRRTSHPIVRDRREKLVEDTPAQPARGYLRGLDRGEGGGYTRTQAAKGRWWAR